MKKKQIYYHFLSAKDAIDDFERKRIKVSLIDSLNDPFELMPYLRYQFKERQRYHKVRREIIKRYGLLCFSQSWHEPLLWSHYANGHNGIALGFKISESGNRFFKVKYASNPIRKQVDLTDNLRANKELILDLAKIKYKKWEYEKEYRVVVELKDCEMNGGHYFVKFSDALKLEEIVIGCKCNKYREYVSKLGRRCNVKVTPTRMEWQGYKIVIRG